MTHTTATGTTDVHVMGKCPAKGCKSRRRVTLRGMRILRDRYRTYTELLIPAGDGWHTMSPYTILGVDRPSRSARVAFNGRYERARLAAMRAVGWVCDEHDQYMRLTPIKGVVNLDKSCDGRCMNATGPNCECSCGGENHGGSWSP